MDNLAIHFLNDDEQLVTQEAVSKLIFNIRNNQIANSWLALDEYGEGDFLSVDIANRWVALAFNTLDENGIARMYQPINQKYEDSQEDAPVNIGSQTPVLKRNAIDNLDLAAECVLHFAKTGELYPNLKWEETK